MTTCAACGRETAPYGELMPNLRVVTKCGWNDCRQPIDGSRVRPATDPLATAAPQVLPAVADRPLLAPPAPVRVPSPPIPAPQNLGPRVLADQLAELRARREHVKRQLAEMAALQREEAALDRMLAAADEPPN